MSEQERPFSEVDAKEPESKSPVQPAELTEKDRVEQADTSKATDERNDDGNAQEVEASTDSGAEAAAEASEAAEEREKEDDKAEASEEAAEASGDKASAASSNGDEEEKPKQGLPRRQRWSAAQCSLAWQLSAFALTGRTGVRNAGRSAREGARTRGRLERIPLA